MPNWNEIHYRRAADLVQSLSAALDPTPAPAQAAAAAPAALVMPSPRPVAPAAAPQPAAPTTAAVFKNIPWKK
jgi:hypothetical protein